MSDTNPNLGQQWHQLPMFMTGREIKETAHPNDAFKPERQTGYGSIDHTWKLKLQESKDWGYVDDMREGIHTPVRMTEPVKQSYTGEWKVTPILQNGHHRVATAAEYYPNHLIPISWDRGRP